MLAVNSEQVRQIGYGAMGLEGYYGDSEDHATIETLVHAIDRNMMIDAADAYGAGED